MSLKLLCQGAVGDHPKGFIPLWAQLCHQPASVIEQKYLGICPEDTSVKVGIFGYLVQEISVALHEDLGELSIPFGISP